MESFDVAVALRVMVGRAAVCDAELRQGLHKPCRSKLRAVVGGQSEIAFSTPRRQTLEHRLFHGVQRFLGPTAMRKVPTHDFPRATVNHTDQISPTDRWSRPDLGHVRLPDPIRLCCFYTAPFFLSSCSQASRANEQAPLTHHPQHPLAIHGQSFLPAQPPGHAPVAVGRFFSASLNDLFIPSAIGSTSSRLLPVVQARSADDQSCSHDGRRVPLLDQRSCLGVNFTAAHSPTTFFRISISRALRPRLRSSCRIRRSFSVSAAAALLPPSAAFAPCSASSFQR